jgi:hypothetical protein
MRTFLLSTAFLTAVLATGCAGDGPVQPADTRDVAASPSLAGATCENVRGTLAGNAFEPWGLTYAGNLAGPGTLLAAPQLDPRGGGAIHIATMHGIQTADGLITTTDQGVLAPVDAPVYRLINRYTISGGTEGYEGATGFVRVNALVNLATGELEGEYHGRVCR